MNKSQVYLSSFNDVFQEFVDSIVEIFPDDVDILATKTALGLMRKTNPKLLIMAWNTYVRNKYTTEIENGNIGFFINKDYQSDFIENLNSDTILDAINRLRSSVQKLETNMLAKVTDYLQKLNRVCTLYLLSKA
jgi:hypothetical protein